VFLLLAAPVFAAAGESVSFEELKAEYEQQMRPLLQRHCYDCHAGDVTEGDLDLAAFQTVADAQNETKVWLRVREMLESGQMPPKDAEQPTDDERARLKKWVRGFLLREAEAHAGDPGPVVLRRLGNAEYTYSIRDLTSVDSLDPTREFPVDGAAGEGFTNTGNAQGMSPALVRKYLDAAKEVARHMVLRPDGIGFSQYESQRDQTDELVARIQAFYRQFTAEGGGTAVNLQGIQFDTNQGGILPLAEYLTATLQERDALSTGSKSVDQVAGERTLNTKYLATLWNVLSAKPEQTSSPLIDDLRSKWRQLKPQDVSQLTVAIAKAQKTLWKFNAIGHIGSEGKPKTWIEAVSPLTSRREIRLELPASQEDVTLSLVASDAGDGNDGDFVVWENPRLVGENPPDLPLRDLAGLLKKARVRQHAVLSQTIECLKATAALAEMPENATEEVLTQTATEHGVDLASLNVWLDYLAIGESKPVEVTGHIREKLQANDYNFVAGWGSNATPNIVGNASDQEVRIPGKAPPHSIVAHPSPTLFVAVGWQSPFTGLVRVDAQLADAHPECGNGQEWVVQYRTSRKVGNLGQGTFDNGGSVAMPPKTISVRRGELVSLIVGPRDGNHSCDLTQINLVITETEGDQRTWDLAKDVSGTMQDANPHADSHGNAGTWHFYLGEMASVRRNDAEFSSVPAGSLLARWQEERDATKRAKLARGVQALVIGDPPADKNSPDAELYDQLMKLAFSPRHLQTLLTDVEADDRFGKHPLGEALDSSDLIVQAPSVVEFRIPAELANGRTLVTTGRLDTNHGREGSVNLEALAHDAPPDELPAATPVVVNDDSKARHRIEAGFDDFRNLFPPAICYERIVPVDEVVTLTLFYRHDEPLQRLMLDDRQITQLNQLWDELIYVSREPLKYQVAFEQIREFASQDRPDLVKTWAPLVQSVEDRANAFRQQLLDTESIHVDAILEFANNAWRRPLTDAEQVALRNLYQGLRDGELAHEPAVRLTLARVLASPAFLYKLESPATGKEAAPISNLELATRLSYFLWSSLPDEQLRATAETGRLTNDEVLFAETGRMLADPRTRRLAIQFACQWLHVRDFDTNDDKNEQLYPEFAVLREAMYEETVRFFEDMFRNDGSILGLLEADHTFLNESLARHYGVDGVAGSEWQRVDGLRANGRGGILGMATILASQSGASRTSPILRGNWISETLLGERLPRPPADVPQLPEEVPQGLTARELIERHGSVAACAKCHERIDPYGFALEQYDAIGRLRPVQVDTKGTLLDGKTIEGIEGLRDYLAGDRREDVVGQFCRKILGYALGREVQLSDEPLLKDMQTKLQAEDYRFRVVVETIVSSPQFRQVRGQQATEN
jgi:hypothetical protein